jgi:pSer/pThr/pTyr-binding forkhead associated (FHA) protein
VAAPAASAPADQTGGSTAPPIDSALKPTQAIPSAGPAGSGVSLEYEGPTSKGRLAMAGDEVKIGRRDADAGIYPELDFEGNDLVVDAGERVHAVSRRHARVFRDGGDLKFEDLGSTNGSTLNGAAVLAHDPQPLNDGDRIVLGRTCRITVHVS